MFSAFFSPIGRVFGKMGELVVDVFSTCSSSKLQRQLIMAVKVGTSASRLQMEVRVTTKQCEHSSTVKMRQIGWHTGSVGN